MKSRSPWYAPISLVLAATFAVIGCATAPETEPVQPAAAAEPLPEKPEPDPYESISLAMALGDVEAAIAAFEAAYSTNPDDPETKSLYAKLLIAGGKLGEPYRK